MVTTVPVVIEKSADGSIWVEQRQTKNHQYETLIVKINNHQYRIADERVWEKGLDGHRYYYNDSDDSYGHEFESSRDKKWLFVTRKCFHKVDIAYLYHFNEKRFVRVRPSGHRFDEAALRYFGKALHFAVPGFGSGGARITSFKYWPQNGRGIVFRLVESAYTRRQIDETGRLITGYYSLQNKTFTLLECKKY